MPYELIESPAIGVACSCGKPLEHTRTWDKDPEGQIIQPTSSLVRHTNGSLLQPSCVVRTVPLPE